MAVPLCQNLASDEVKEGGREGRDSAVIVCVNSVVAGFTAGSAEGERFSVCREASEEHP